MVLQQLVAAFEPWKSAYSNSKVIPAVVTSVHLVALQDLTATPSRHAQRWLR